MIKTIQVVNRFRMGLVLNEMYPPPKNPFAVISIYSTPQEELITPEKFKKLQEWGCVGCLSMLFQDGSLPQDEEWLEYPFTDNHAKEVKEFLDRINSLEEKIFLIAHCDAGISRSGAVATFAADYLEIPFHDPMLMPNPYVLRLLDRLVWIENL